MGLRIVHLTSLCCSEIVRGASQLGYRSLVSFCKFIGIFESLLICSHDDGCKIALKSGNLEYGTENNTVLYPLDTAEQSGLLRNYVASHGCVFGS